MSDHPPRPRTRSLRIIAQDPAVSGPGGRILTAEVAVPAEKLQPGPRGCRVHVIDYDATGGVLYHPPEHDYAEDPYRRASDDVLLGDPGFHCQNVYAVAMRTLARFEHALGRRVGWSFSSHQIQIAPHAFCDANAFYSREDQAIVFGYFPGSKGTVFTCLSHDVVAHETTHALIDGLRERYNDPSSPDQAAFHEGFADIAALLSVFSVPVLVETLLDLQAPRRHPERIEARRVEIESLRQSALMGLAEQMGREMAALRGSALRRSVELPPSDGYLKKPEFLEPHRRGEILVSAVLNSFLAVWRNRIRGLGEVAPGFYSRQRVAEEGASAAGHLLTMCIRALDYSPPTDIEFSDFLSALLTADAEVMPDDSRYRYRPALLETFQSFGIAPSSKDPGGIWEPPESSLSYDFTHFEAMQRDPDEVFRFLWENREALGVSSDAYTRVLSVRPCTRVAPDGFVLRETAAEYIQILKLRAAELAEHGIRKPDRMPGNLPVTLYGGGALIFDEYGRLKFHIRNKVLNPERQTRRLKYLWEYGFFDRGGAARNRLSELHRRRMMGLPMETVEV